MTCYVCNETEAGCKEEPEDAKIVECQLNDPDGPNYGNACLVGHNGIPHNFNLEYSIKVICSYFKYMGKITIEKTIIFYLL